MTGIAERTAGFMSTPAGALARSWPALAMRGGVGVLFGLLMVVRPVAGLSALALLFGVFALIDGALNIVAGMRRREMGGVWGGLVLAGVLAIAAGAVTLWYPLTAVLFLVYVVAAWAAITGIGQIVAAVRLRREIRGEWLLGLAGALSVLFGLALLFVPIAGAVVLGVWIGAYALFAGVLQLVLAWRLRGWARGGARPLVAGR